MVQVTPVQQAEVLLALQRSLPEGMQIRHAGIGNPGPLEFTVWDLRSNCMLGCTFGSNDIARWTKPFGCECGWACDLSEDGVREIAEHALCMAEGLRHTILHLAPVEGRA